MSWRLVEGVPLPDAVGGHPALDFCNTRAGWGSPRPKEYLTAPHVLALWARENGITGDTADDPTDDPADGATAAAPSDEAALARALALREALYACTQGRGSPADWARVAAEAADARARGRLVGRDGTPAHWAPLAPQGGAAAALWGIAMAAEDLLTSPLAPFVAACPGTGCGWVFADRRRKRRWCSMAACGNRAKARRYAERHGLGAPGDDDV
jgi:predicted RNA-binding Zn ribbon-like protein